MKIIVHESTPSTIGLLYLGREYEVPENEAQALIDENKAKSIEVPKTEIQEPQKVVKKGKK